MPITGYVHIYKFCWQIEFLNTQMSMMLIYELYSHHSFVGSIQLVVETGQCDTEPILICMVERDQFTRAYQWAIAQNDVCDSIVFHNDMHDIGGFRQCGR